MRLQTLFQEERAAYEAALEDARDTDGNIDPLAALQHAATYQHHLASLIEIILGASQLPA
jgi:BRCC36 C-terminal helical domain